MSRSVEWVKIGLLAVVVASTVSCVVEERGRRGRTVVVERGRGHGHAYGHERHGR